MLEYKIHSILRSFHSFQMNTNLVNNISVHLEIGMHRSHGYIGDGRCVSYYKQVIIKCCERHLCEVVACRSLEFGRHRVLSAYNLQVPIVLINVISAGRFLLVMLKLT